MRPIKLNLIILLLTLFATSLHAELSIKLRDLMYIDGFKENQLLGFGLVVGLQGTGDSKSMLTQTSMKNIISNIGIDSSESHASKNIAAVLVTAKLPPYARVGDRIDVTVSSIGDAKSLEGGILIQSPLKGADDKIYAVAQGTVSISIAQKGGKDIKTVARIPGGGIVERDIEPDFIVKDSINLVLRAWDFSMANQIIKALAQKLPNSKPAIAKGGKINIAIPKDASLAEFISTIENIEITPVYQARVVINERDGTIVMGGEVKISEIMVSREGITVKVEGGKQGGKETAAAKGSAAIIKETSTIKDLVDSMNYIGATTKDIISILKAMKEAGALHAELIIR